MEDLEYIEQKLESKGYKILIEKMPVRIEINFRRYKSGTQKEHGRICLSKNDLDTFIQNLMFIREELDY